MTKGNRDIEKYGSNLDLNTHPRSRPGRELERQRWSVDSRLEICTGKLGTCNGKLV